MSKDMILPLFGSPILETHLSLTGLAHATTCFATRRDDSTLSSASSRFCCWASTLFTRTRSADRRPREAPLFLPLEFCSSFLHSRSLFCGTDRDIRCSCPNVQTSQLRPISGRSQFEVSEAPLFADVPHVGRQHGQHLLVGPAGLRPPGYGVNGKRMSQILQARRQRAVLSEDARCPSKPAKCWPQHEVR